MTLRPLFSRPLPTLTLVAVAWALAPGRAFAADAPPAPVAPVAPAKADDVLAHTLGHLTLGEGLVADPVILFPLILPTPPPVLDLGAALGEATVRFEEVAGAVGGDRVRVTNTADKDVLLLGGTVLAGGTRDRIVREDLLLPAGASAEATTAPASVAGERRATPSAFRIADFLAPPYLRESALFRSAPGIAPAFVSHFLEFRNAGDARKSLVAVGASEVLAAYCLPCQRSMAEWPKKRESGWVVGGVAVVRGRVQEAVLFATNAQLMAWFSPLLKSLSFPAAAIELRAKQAGIPTPGGDDPAKVLAAASSAARDLVAGFAKATVVARTVPSGASGEALTVTLPGGERGTAILAGGHVLHLALYPGDPFEYGLYAQPLEPMEGDDASWAESDRAGLVELDRRQRLGSRLTEAERRLLERLRDNRGLRQLPPR
jgi:hypothetical protein